MKIQLNDFDFAEKSKELKVLSNVISLWEKEYSHDAHWKYIPDSNVDQHREFYIHNFCPYSKKNGVMTDINYKRWLENNGTWKEGTPLYEHVNVYSYPLPTTTYKKAMSEILDYCKNYNLYGLGRWGTWRYFNVDQCIKQAMDFFEDPKQFNYGSIF
jgi:UDP-galactopyranose mutase